MLFKNKSSKTINFLHPWFVFVATTTRIHKIVTRVDACQVDSWIPSMTDLKFDSLSRQMKVDFARERERENRIIDVEKVVLLLLATNNSRPLQLEKRRKPGLVFNFTTRTQSNKSLIICQSKRTIWNLQVNNLNKTKILNKK